MTEPSIENLRKAASAIYIAVDQVVADDISNLLKWAANQIEEKEWTPHTDKRMAFFKREEKGIYTDEGTPGLFYFKATHWRYIK